MFYGYFIFTDPDYNFSKVFYTLVFRVLLILFCNVNQFTARRGGDAIYVQFRGTQINQRESCTRTNGIIKNKNFN